MCWYVLEVMGNGQLVCGERQALLWNQVRETKTTFEMTANVIPSGAQRSRGI